MAGADHVHDIGRALGIAKPCSSKSKSGSTQSVWGLNHTSKDPKVAGKSAQAGYLNPKP